MGGKEGEREGGRERRREGGREGLWEGEKERASITSKYRCWPGSA